MANPLDVRKTAGSSMLIGQLARLEGVKTDTIRYYERRRLLPKPVRTVSDYRLYDAAALKRVRFIKRAQALGFTLDEIARILSLSERGEETCRCVITMAENTLIETEKKLAELQRFRDALHENLGRWRRQSGRATAAEFCQLIESTNPDSADRRD